MARMTATTTPQAIATGDPGLVDSVGFKAAAKVWIDKTSGVTADDASTGGVEVEAGQWVTENLAKGETLYVVVASGTSRVQYILSKGR